MANVWRIYLIKDIPTSPNYGKYCLNNKVAAMGWILDKYNDDIKAGKIEIKTYSDYAYYAAKCFDDFNAVRRLAEEIKPGDFIWTCVDKSYYIAKVSAQSRYHYNFSDEAIYYRACNELTNIDWKFVGDKEYVDENIIKRFGRGQTLCRLFAEKNPKFAFGLKYSEERYNRICSMERLEIRRKELREREDFEEILRKRRAERFTYTEDEVKALKFYKNMDEMIAEAEREGKTVILCGENGEPDKIIKPED